VIPYLTSDGIEVTCATRAREAQRVGLDRCLDFTTQPVPVDGQAFCGCENTSPANLCQLCPPDSPFNEALTVPEAGGMTCGELKQYLQYVTDENSCNAIAALATPCCEQLDPCPVCGNDDQNFARDKIYEPYSLSCENIGLANRFGHSLSCNDVQNRFDYFCRCPYSTPKCTLCGNGEPPVDLNRVIPFLDTTCGAINDFASLRFESECREMDYLSVDVKSFCGCTNYRPRNLCALCPPGYTVIDEERTSRAADNATCGELASFAPFIVQADLCASVQSSATACCRPEERETAMPVAGTAKTSTNRTWSYFEAGHPRPTVSRRTNAWHLNPYNLTL